MRLLSLPFAFMLSFALSAAQAQIITRGTPPNLSDPDSPEQILLSDLNQARVQHGLRPLLLDANLSAAAQKHADRMVTDNVLEHELPGEQGLAERCATSGAQFSLIAENIAVGGTLHGLHASWMHSPPHYENIMTAEFTDVGIGVARRGRSMFAVEDFSVAVAAQTREAVEQRVRDMLAMRSIDPGGDPAEARTLCGSEARSATARLVIHFASSNMDKLGPILDRKVPAGAYQKASVGACKDRDMGSFARFKVALLFY